MYVILIIAKLCYIVQNTNLKPQITQPYVEGMSNQWYPLRLAHQEHANFYNCTHCNQCTLWYTPSLPCNNHMTFHTQPCSRKIPF